MALLSDRDEKDVRAKLAGLTGRVTLVNFTQELSCQYCRETEPPSKTVPRTVVNESGSIAGAIPEAEFVKAVIAAAQSRRAAFVHTAGPATPRANGDVL